MNGVDQVFVFLVSVCCGAAGGLLYDGICALRAPFAHRAVTIVTDSAITKAGFNLAVTANAEQIPKICTVTGFVAPNGEVSNLRFFAEKNGSFSFLSLISI